MSPEAQTVLPGTVTVDIKIANAVDLGGYLFTVTWDDTILDFVSVSDGPFLGSTGRAVVCAPVTLVPGSATFTCSSIGTGGGPSGAGTIASVQFVTLADGTTPIVLADAKMKTTSGTLFNILKEDGEVIVESPSPTPADTFTPTDTWTPTDTFTPTDTPTVTPTPTDTPTATDTPAPTSTSTPTNTPTSTPVPTPTPPVGNVLVFPPHQNVSGTTVSVDIKLAGSSDLGGYQFTLTWDPLVLQFAGVTNGTLLGSTGRSVSCNPPITGLLGSISFDCTSTGTQAGPNGAGVLATIQFSTVQSGRTSLVLSDVQVVTSTGAIYSINSTGGDVQVN